ncbi:hypothetical protein M8A51_23535 [Schlegelella sp. S2-27]|uniref:Uncharacterized protein n=1 Tax=Caldimonas mangrovi TaxID=2944811 RepID=A0ABT0YV83_9BURK|nr:hypothetical protein [Caldimonas mangrovi]MCM5682513.1 hypothetical protein [Caldimonas mangrovi]
MGYYGKRRIREGEKFSAPEDAVPSWAQPVKVYEAEQAAKEAAKPKKPQRGQSLKEAAEETRPLPTGDREVI